ncbi:MAG: helix-turn-helix domain-containing protein [Rhodomicrobium sp.]|nr:helix-turn-helix domain-containing protein [Rhodomicrobium sp.]
MPRTTNTPVSRETAVFAQELIARLGDGPVALGNAATGETTPLPPHIAELLRQVLTRLAAGKNVTVTEALEEVTPNEAAEYLNVSRPYIAKLMDEGVLPYRQVGNHRRIPFADLAAYREQERARARKSMREVTRLSEELGLYNLEPADNERPR